MRRFNSEQAGHAARGLGASPLLRFTPKPAQKLCRVKLSASENNRVTEVAGRPPGD